MRSRGSPCWKNPPGASTGETQTTSPETCGTRSLSVLGVTLPFASTTSCTLSGSTTRDRTTGRRASGALGATGSRVAKMPTTTAAPMASSAIGATMRRREFCMGARFSLLVGWSCRLAGLGAGMELGRCLQAVFAVRLSRNAGVAGRDPGAGRADGYMVGRAARSPAAENWIMCRSRSSSSMPSACRAAQLLLSSCPLIT